MIGGRGTDKTKHRIILTGGSGALGRNFLDQIANDDSCQVLSLLRQQSRLTPDITYKYQRIDFSDRTIINQIIQDFQPTCFVHSAATGMNFAKPDWFDLVRFNVNVSLNFCEAVAKLPGCRFIFISTGLAYKDQGRILSEADPLDTLHPYGASKAAADVLIRSAADEFGVPLTVLRPFSFTGRWDDGTRLFPSLLRAAVEGKRFEMSAGDQMRDHCSARDIAAGIIAAIKTQPHVSKDAHIFNLGSGSVQPLRPLIESIVTQLNIPITIDFGARPYASHEPKCLVADIQAAQRDLGWTPVHNLAHAVWQLAEESFPSLKLTEPRAYTRV
jgi:nucleoside-diphosphate-sugar epimerase